MHDFTSKLELLEFFTLGPMKPANEQPLRSWELKNHRKALISVGVSSGLSAFHFEQSLRFLNTFRPDAKAPGGGDVAYIIP